MEADARERRERRNRLEQDRARRQPRDDQHPVPGKATRVEASAGETSPVEGDRLLGVAETLLAPLAEANRARDPHASALLAARLQLAIDHALHHADATRESRVGTVVARAEEVLAAAFVPSRAALDESVHWGSAKREAWDRDVAAWTAVERAASSLPFADQIQRSFGAHDITGVRVAFDPAATGALGARAFAFGERIAFAGAPDLHTAAHEAAHVVQQRHGIAGDGEVHADAVADLVVRGESAEHLLGANRGGSTTARVQLKSASAPASAATRSAPRPTTCRSAISRPITGRRRARRSSPIRFRKPRGFQTPPTTGTA